jgi:hypothetical protein
MLTIDEWLLKAGFQANRATGGNNPFALKQAEFEGDLLTEYFVEHPAFNQILDREHPRSSILFAPRGAGKSSALKMFTTHWQGRVTARPLFVYLTDWLPFLEQRPTIEQISIRDHLHELLRRTVQALARQRLSRPAASIPPTSAEYLAWLCDTQSQYLTPDEQQALAQPRSLCQPSANAHTIYSNPAFPIIEHLHLLASTVRALGYTSCYVLIDNIDELPQTVADADAGARIIAPLIGTIRLHEVPGLAFKYFIPSEVYIILREQHLLREDRMNCSSLHWEPEQLTDLLRNRLAAFSDNRIDSLAPFAEPDILDIDERLSRAVVGSPRHLLNLGEWLLQASAADASDQSIQIRQTHFTRASAAYRAWLSQQRPGALPPEQPLAPPPVPPAPAPATVPDMPPIVPDIPLLRLRADGCVLRGNSEIEGWDRLPRMQRTLLEYLYQHHNQICSKEQIIAHVWKDKDTPASDSSLRKLTDRLRRWLEPAPDNPVYIQSIAGGSYVLRNAAHDNASDR